MNCERCNGPTRVKDSRPDSIGKQVRRRRVCDDCGASFFTLEIYESRHLDYDQEERASTFRSRLFDVRRKLVEMAKELERAP